MGDTTIEEQILRRLNLLILMQLEKFAPDSRTTTTSKVQWLLGVGLQPVEVASIIGKPVNYVTAISSGARNTSKKTDRSRGND